ncbi:hypothetical protein DEO72_LG1g3126 [Vigna unguiculata]|uniref:Uncharacterized protein n=1 Tax=Vigna unguiculata TaxID=3917 RepID=A0A4D6KZE0_VIGUN|nr:hypothetical protein DEO72_LG1g3126 [Vigna unguiculata]
MIAHDSTLCLTKSTCNIMCSTSLNEYLKIHLLPHLQATTCRTCAGNLLRTTLHNAMWSSQYERSSYCPKTTKLVGKYRGGQSSGPIRMSHNSHTHIGNTRQSKPQLKDSSCSSAIPSHNSRDVIPSHNSKNVTCLTLILSHNSRDTFRATT